MTCMKSDIENDRWIVYGVYIDVEIANQLHKDGKLENTKWYDIITRCEENSVIACWIHRHEYKNWQDAVLPIQFPSHELETEFKEWCAKHGLGTPRYMTVCPDY